MSDEREATLEGSLGSVLKGRLETLVVLPTGVDGKPIRIHLPPGETPPWMIDVLMNLKVYEGRAIRVTGTYQPATEGSSGVDGLGRIVVSRFELRDVATPSVPAGSDRQADPMQVKPNRRADLYAEIASIAATAKKVREQRGNSGHGEFFSSEGPIAAFVAIGRSLLDDPSVQQVSDFERCRAVDPSWTLSVLNRCLMSSDDDMREAAIRGLGVSMDGHGWGSVISRLPKLLALEHVSILIDHVASERTHGFILLLHLQTLLQRGAPREAYVSRFELIRSPLSESDSSVRAAAIRLIAEISGDAASAALPDLVACLDAQDSDVREAAQSALSRITGHSFWFGGSSRKRWSKWLARQGKWPE